MPALKFVRAVVLAFASSLALSTPAQVVVSPITAQVFTPGAISAMAVQPDGKVILAGTGEGMPNGIGRFNTDGSTDFSWSPPVFYGGSADRVWIDPAGAVYVGGSFSAVGGVARNRLARLSGTTGALDTTWNPGPNAAVATMAFFNGAIYVGGQFSNIGGQTRAGLAKLSATGSGAADPTWNPGSGGNYLSIVADASGNLYVGGTFTISGALPFTFFNNLVRLGSAGAGAVDQNWNPSPDATVLSLALDGAGGLFVGGTFATIGGQSRSRLAKIPTGGNGAADPTWNPAPNNSPSALALDGSSLYVVGLFTNIGGANRSFIARLAATGTGAADSWNPGANSSVNLVAVSPSSAFVGGAFASAGVNGGGRFGFVALDKVSGSASSLYPRMLAGGVVNAIVRDASGRTVVGGRFQYVGDGTFNTTRPNIARFNPDGTLDNTWSPQVNGTVRALALSLSGLLYVGGDSLTVGGNYRGGVVRIPMSGSGGVDSWSPFADGSVHALALDDSGNIYAGGYFGSIGFETASNLARVSTSTGFADAAWKPNPDGVVSALALDGQGNLFAAGSFNAIGALTRQSVAKLSTVGAGSADAAWNANISGPVHALEIDHSGNVFVGGSFTVPAIIGTRRSLVRLSVAGGVLDLGFATDMGSGSTVYSLARDNLGNLYVGGLFSSIGGVSRRGIARVSATGTGTVDSTWIANAGGLGSVFAMELDGTGNICVGGAFSFIANQSRMSYACISPTAPPAAPSITSANSATFALLTAGAFAVTTTGSPAPTVSVSGTLPTGLSLSAGTGVISGTPAAGTVGAYPLTITAANGVAPNATQSFTLTVAPTVPAKPAITSIIPGNAQATVAFSVPNDGGRPIVSNLVTCTSGGSTQTGSGPASPIVVTGLNNGSTYTCRVTSTNDQGTSTPSDPASVTPSTFFNLGTFDFGGQSMGTTSAVHVVTLTNNGNLGPLTITGVTLSPQFGQTNDCGAALAVGATCTVTITFSPAAVVGPLNSTLTVNGTLAIVTNVGYFTALFAGTAEKSLITHYYVSILGRLPEAGGKAFWAGEATRVANLGANVNEVWFALAQQFYISPEYLAFNRTNNGFVTDLYRTFFNRAPDSGGLDFWTQQLAAGLPREVLLAQFMFSPEFANFTNAIFSNVAVRAEVNTAVDFYRGLLSRLPDDGGLNYWVGRFRAAQCQGPAAIVAEVETISSQFALSTEYLARARTTAQYVGDLYNAFLRRGGDLPGVQFWINQINTGARTREQVRVEFKNSPEFQARVTAIINQGCLP